MSTFNTSTRKEDLSMKLRTQNMKYTRTQTKKLEEDSRKMEERLKELKTAMSREKEERERHGGGFWDRGQSTTGSLTNYASEVLKSKPQIVPKDGKKKKIKVLQDEPIDLPQRSSQPGTMKYIAQQKMTSGPSPREKQKGPKCGQCEERAATLSCVQCSEMYCAACFAAFHLKGALKKHRSVPISASGPRVCMSPRPSLDPQSPRGSQASGSTSLYEMQPPVNGSEASGPPSTRSTPRNDGLSLLQGDYDESESAASFQAALMAWRQGDSASPPEVSDRNPRPIASPVRSPVMSVDSSTGTTEQAKIPDFKFTASLSYAEKLMLKKHRRTEVAEVATPRLQSQTDNYHGHRQHSARSSRQMESQHSSRDGNKSRVYSQEDNFVQRDASFIADEERVNFQALFEAVTGTESSSPVRPMSDPSYPTAIPADAPILSSSSLYLISEVSPFESWQTEQRSDRYPDSSTFVVGQPEEEKKNLPIMSSSQRKLDAVTELYSTAASPLPISDEKENSQREANLSAKSKRSHVDRIGSASSKEFNDKEGEERKDNEEQSSWKELTNKNRPKSVRAKSAKSRPASRAQSRAQSRAASRMGKEEGNLTKAPSLALSQIAQMSQDKEYVYQSPMEGFFLVGVDGGMQVEAQENRHTQPRPKSRGQALKSARGEREPIKVSNRLYQMAPRSWRPDSSLGETVPVEDIHVQEEDPTMVLAYSYSGQLSGRATEWRPSSSQSGIFPPGDDLGLMTRGEATESWIPPNSSLSQREMDANRKSKDTPTPTPHSVTPRKKSASRRSINSATPVNQSRDLHSSPTDTPTPRIESSEHENRTPLRTKSRRETRTGQSHSSSSLSNQPSPSGGIPVQVKSGVPDVASQSRSHSRISSSKGGNRIAVDILPSKSDLIASPHKPSRSHRPDGGLSSSRQGSQDPIAVTSHRGSRSREGSHLSSKNSNLVRHHSDVDQTQRPSSSSQLSEVQSQRTKHEDRRPNSSTGGKEGISSTKRLSHSFDVESTNDTVVADMLADRVHTDVWMKGDHPSEEVEERRSTQPQAGQRPTSKSKRPNSGQWETEVIPFDRESVESRQSILSARDSQADVKRKRRPLSSRPSSTMSGRESRAVAMEGEDLSLYDHLGQEMERDHDDEETLDKLEWELASDTGRLTADGKVSRLGVLEQEEDRNSQSSSRSSNRSLRMSMDRDYDISAKLQEDDRLAQKDLDDFNLRRSMTMDEDDVKALG